MKLRESESNKERELNTSFLDCAIITRGIFVSLLSFVSLLFFILFLFDGLSFLL